MATFLKSFFVNPECDVVRGGLRLKHPDGSSLHLWIKLGMQLQDGLAHKMVMGFKGDSGCRFCTLCLNAWCSVSPVLGDDDKPLMICTMTKCSEIIKATDADTLGAIDRLALRKADPKCSPDEFERWQKASGLLYQEHGLLSDPVLRAQGIVQPCSQYCHDPMHTMIANGVLNVVLWLLLVALSHHFNIWQILHQYVALWTTPRHFKNIHLHEMFNKKREDSCKNSGKGLFKCMASELLGVYPILAYYFQSLLHRGNCNCRLEIIAFLLCCDLMDLLCAIPLGIIQPGMLRSAVDALLQACKDAGWTDRLIKKFHWILHFPDELEQWLMIPTCFSLERKHRLVKRFAQTVRNTVAYVKSIYKDVLSHELAKLRQPDIFKHGVFLVNSHKASKKTLSFICGFFDVHIQDGACSVSNVAHIEPDGFAEKGDVVLLRASAGDTSPWCAAEVWLHVEVSGQQPMSLVSMYTFVSHEERLHSATWRATVAPMFVYTHDLLCSTTYKKSLDGLVTTLIPLPFR